MWTGEGWNLNMRRNLNVWEVSGVATFYTTMANFNNLSEERDTIVRKKERKCTFSVNSAYRELNRPTNREEN